MDYSDINSINIKLAKKKFVLKGQPKEWTKIIAPLWIADFRFSKNKEILSFLKIIKDLQKDIDYITKTKIFSGKLDVVNIAETHQFNYLPITY